MKYLKEAATIWGISLLGEMLNKLLPFPVPVGVYGLFILLFLLCTGILKLNDVEHVGDLLLDIMPVLFVPATVALMDNFGLISSIIVELVVIMAVSTIVVMIVSGRVAEFVIIRQKKKQKAEEN